MLAFFSQRNVRLVRAVTCIWSYLFLYVSRWYSLAWMRPHQSTLLLVDGAGVGGPPTVGRRGSLRIKLLWVFLYRSLCKHTFSFLWGKYLAEKWLSHAVCVRLSTQRQSVF